MVGRRRRAPAKLNLTLRVLGTRPDGFHELEALTVTVTAPADALHGRARAGGEVTLRSRAADADVPTGADNLVVRAARAVLPGRRRRARSRSRRPSRRARASVGFGRRRRGAAGAAGPPRPRPGCGAAAAAATRIGRPGLCATGRPVMMRGRGELLDPVELADDLHVVIATPAIRVPTPAVFRAWDDARGLGPAGSWPGARPPSAISCASS